MHKAIVQKSLISSLLILGLNTTVYAETQPKFSIVADPSTPTSGSLPSNLAVSVNYRVTNNTSITRTLTMQAQVGVTQVTTGTDVCPSPFILAAHASCILKLTVDGNVMSNAGLSSITEGPVVCKTQGNGDNSPSPFLCSQANAENSLNIRLSANPFAIGDSLAGGKLACLDGAGLIAATADATDMTGIPWGSQTFIGGISDTSTAPPDFCSGADDGACNTARIVSAFGLNSSYAAGLCRSYAIDAKGETCTAGEAGCYSDWFLPAKNQLNCLYDNRVVITGFSPSFYWSSTEYSLTPTDSAWGHHFGTGTPGDADKPTSQAVRCVRALTL